MKQELRHIKQEFEPSSSLKNQLVLKDISFLVNIGTTEEERAKRQEIFVSLQIHFSHTPKAALTDSLPFQQESGQQSSGICYEEVLKILHSALSSKPFHLIEHLAYTCYQSLKKTWTHSGVKFQVSVKKFPSYLPQLKGGAIYTFGDHI